MWKQRFRTQYVNLQCVYANTYENTKNPLKTGDAYVGLNKQGYTGLRLTCTDPAFIWLACTDPAFIWLARQWCKVVFRVDECRFSKKIQVILFNKKNCTNEFDIILEILKIENNHETYQTQKCRRCVKNNKNRCADISLSFVCVCFQSNHVLRDFNYVVLGSFCMWFCKMLYVITYKIIRDYI